MKIDLKVKRPRSKRCPKFRGMGRKAISLLTRLDREYLEIIIQEVSNPELSEVNIDKELVSFRQSGESKLLSPITMNVVDFMYEWITRHIKVKFTDTGRYAWKGIWINKIKVK